MNPAPSVHGLRVALTVADFDAALRLFRDGFGLPVVQQWTVGEGRGIVLAAGQESEVQLTSSVLGHAAAMVCGGNALDSMV